MYTLNTSSASHPMSSPLWVPNNYYVIMKQINPNIEINHALSVVYSVFQYGIKFNVEPHIILAMLAQESKFEMKAESKTQDYSIAQFNIATIKHRGLNKNRLTSDLNYAVYNMAKMLSELKLKHGKKEKTWFSRYNTATPSKRKAYEKQVLKFYNKFNQCGDYRIIWSVL
jgi:hypothetical protein